MLWYLKSKDHHYQMCPIFGIVQSTFCGWLNYSLQVLYEVVRDTDNIQFRIRWPTAAEISFSTPFLSANGANGSLLNGVFAIIDGARMNCSAYDDTAIQNAFWEGFAHGNEVTSVFAWDFRVELIQAAMNYPGIWHDSRIATSPDLYRLRLESMTSSDFAVISDSALSCGGCFLTGKIVRARKTNELGYGSGVSRSALLSANDKLIELAMPSEKQSAKWGFRAIKGPFGRITTTLLANS